MESYRLPADLIVFLYEHYLSAETAVAFQVALETVPEWLIAVRRIIKHDARRNRRSGLSLEDYERYRILPAYLTTREYRRLAHYPFLDRHLDTLVVVLRDWEWDNIDPPPSSSRIVKLVSSLYALSPHMSEWLSTLQGLQVLQLCSPRTVMFVSVCMCLPHLTSLYIHHMCTDRFDIADCTNMTSLTLHDCHILEYAVPPSLATLILIRFHSPIRTFPQVRTLVCIEMNLHELFEKFDLSNLQMLRVRTGYDDRDMVFNLKNVTVPTVILSVPMYFHSSVDAVYRSKLPRAIIQRESPWWLDDLLDECKQTNDNYRPFPRRIV